jgi:beta-mannosidase
MVINEESTLGEAISTEKGKVIIGKHLALAKNYANYAADINNSLQHMAETKCMGLNQSILNDILADFKRPVDQLIAGVNDRKSLDELDRESFKAGVWPMEQEFERIELSKGTLFDTQVINHISLDGEWQLAQGGMEPERLSGAWQDGIVAEVPGSIHTALFQAGKLPDPTIGLNQKIARSESFKTWWMMRTFNYSSMNNSNTNCPKNIKIIFSGVANKCKIWLNGNLLGSHEGMFGGPEFDVSQYIKEINTLIVMLEPIPFESEDTDGSNPDNNGSWRKTAVINNVYGWHYSNLPSLGIWQSVKIHDVPVVSMPNPFISAKNAKDGLMDLLINLESTENKWSGLIKASIEPENFPGETYCFENKVSSDSKTKQMRFEFKIPEAHLWWPVDLGRPDLYKLRLFFTPDAEGDSEYKEIIFGIRTVEMKPLPDGARPDKYNWTFSINGEPHFVKGTGWCTMDALLDFSKIRYERFISLAKLQHVQMLRAWGSGMPETDEFYDLCNRNGIMVLQEWPTAWNSHEDQPYDIFEETVRLNTLRLRNNPSLVMWGAGNETAYPFGSVIDMMGKISIELDGTRAFHRGEPWGGSVHDYSCYWGREHLDHNVRVKADFFGEFGLASMPVYESVQRYLPENEKNNWPPQEHGAFAHHTPIFNTRDCLSRITQYAHYFVPENCSMKEFIVGSQLSQVVGVRHTLERARTRWPDCSGVLYYKLNDNYPAASWSCVDWYGAPKISHYIFQDSFSPLHACVIFDSMNFAGTPISLPVFLLDDSDELNNLSWKVIVRAFNSELKQIRRAEFSGNGSIQGPVKLGEFKLTFKETDSVPLSP